LHEASDVYFIFVKIDFPELITFLHAELVIEYPFLALLNRSYYRKKRCSWMYITFML